MNAQACAATHFMGGNGHFVSRCSKSPGRETVCHATDLRPCGGDTGSVDRTPADVRGFARRPACGEVLDR